MADPTETRLRKPVPDAASANGRRGDVDDQEALIRHISGGAMQTQHVFVVIHPVLPHDRLQASLHQM